jgi:tRNA-splicing ligase RtcB
MSDKYAGRIERLDRTRWRIPREAQPGMQVDGVIDATERLIDDVIAGGGPSQVANVATLPGIVGASLAMPDIHWGYGFCIGGVAATDVEAGGVVSPGGVGYDINCGVRLLRSDIIADEIRPRIAELVDALYHEIPTGVGVGGPLRLSRKELRQLLARGASALLSRGLAEAEDLERTESGGCLEGADPDAVSDTALSRGNDQCGTLGSGNHFAEIQVVDEVFDEAAAAVMGLARGQVAVMIHSGSRGLGHQVCQDHLRALQSAPRRYGYQLPDRQLVCAPVQSEEGQRYLGAMQAAANFAWCNRQVLATLARRALEKFFGESSGALGLRQVYDVAHNIAKLETHEVEGGRRRLCVHRKGATRAFAPGHPDLPEVYRELGQPVLIPGDMGRASYVLVGTEQAMAQSFGSTCHGAGRVLSRKAAVKRAKGRRIAEELAQRGIIARARSRDGLAEEQPEAYKDVEDVIECVVDSGLSRKVARLRPMGVIKG